MSKSEITELSRVNDYFLDDNKINFFNGNAFAALKKLTEVELKPNVCINENFKTPAEIAKLQQTLDEKCGFDEIAVLKAKIKSFESTKEDLNSSTEEYKSKIIELSVAKAQIDTCNQQLDSIRKEEIKKEKQIAICEWKVQRLLE